MKEDSAKIHFGGQLIPQTQVQSFIALLFAAMAVTFSQGLIIPWTTSVESGHVSALANSLSTSDIYAGLLVAMAFVGGISRRVGLRSLLAGSLAIGTVTIFLFALVNDACWWLLFRFLFGLSLGAIHFGTQAWIGRLTTPEYRGKQMALYGLATGIGFAVGPLFLGTGKLAEYVPFLLSAFTFALSLWLVMRLPESKGVHQDKRLSPKTKATKIYRNAFPVLLFPLVFGFMESTLNGSLPLFAKQIHLSLGVVSASLSSFVIGSLLFQFPLGHASDKFGRRTVLVECSSMGVGLFGVLPWASSSNVVFVTLCFVAGAFLDTLLSMSLGYLADLVDLHALPAANQLAVTNLGLGLMFGPMASGLTMTWLGPPGMFWIVALMYLLYVFCGLIWTPVTA